MRIGDVSRRRRLQDPVRLRWYAHYRSVRFSRRMMMLVNPPAPAGGLSRPQGTLPAAT